MRKQFIFVCIALTMPAIVNAQASLRYFADPLVRAKSDSNFDEAMLAIRIAPSLSKGNSWTEVVEYQKTGKGTQAQVDIRNAALVGNPRALLFMCMARSDRQGPPSLLPEGLAWCRIASNALPKTASIQRDKARALVIQSEQALTPEQIESSKDIEQRLTKEMKASTP